MVLYIDNGGTDGTDILAWTRVWSCMLHSRPAKPCGAYHWRALLLKVVMALFLKKVVMALKWLRPLSNYVPRVVMDLK